MNRDEEIAIINKIIAGNPDCFELLVSENQKIIYNLALKMTSNEEDALDISQEVFIKAYVNLKNFRGDSKFSVWLYRMAYNACLDFIRKNKRVQLSSITYLNDNNEKEDIDIPDLRYSPETQFERSEIQQAISNAVYSLPPEQRQIFIMREYSNMSYEAISNALNLNPGTVKSRLSRARQKIILILSQQGTFNKKFRHKNRKEEHK